jgi:hypothetical protein
LIVNGTNDPVRDIPSTFAEEALLGFGKQWGIHPVGDRLRQPVFLGL